MWLFTRAVKHLPEATGPFVPGCMDVMTGYNENDVFMRLYYPTDVEKNENKNWRKWIPWIPDDSYITGIANVILCKVFLIKMLLWWSGNLRIPALYGEKPRTKDKLNCIILSHGLGGHRFLYSHFCYELASRGFLVAAVEHRDNSASNTYYYESKAKAARNIMTTIEHEHVELGKKHYERRNEQVNKRFKECSKIIDVMIDINNGTVPYNVMLDVPGKQVDFTLNDLVGKLNLDTLTMAGHSFGGATALLTLSRRKELKQGILLDPWMFPIKGEKLVEKVKQPLLFINTQTFHIASNVSAMNEYLNNEGRKMYTILHTTHENQTDSVLLIGYWLNWFMKKLDPIVALRINHSLVLNFLNECIGFPPDIKDCEHYLEEQKHNIDCGLTKPWA